MPRAPRPSPLLRAAAGVLADAGVAPADHLLAAVSGGPDSIALLVALAELARPGGWHVTAAHVDHGLRGEEGASERAAAGAAEQAQEHRLGLIVGRMAERDPRRAHLRGHRHQRAAPRVPRTHLEAAAALEREPAVDQRHSERCGDGRDGGVLRRTLLPT